MLQNLRNFARDRSAENTKSKLMERFKFFKTEKERDHCLELLEKWNKRLHRLTIQVQGQTTSQSWPLVAPAQSSPIHPWNSIVLSVKNPSARIRLLTKDLYTVLSNSWNCSCQPHHEARFCLNLHTHHGLDKSFPDVEAEFYFLVKASNSGSQARNWQEATVGMRKARLTTPSHFVVAAEVL